MQRRQSQIAYLHVAKVSKKALYPSPLLHTRTSTSFDRSCIHDIQQSFDQ